MFKSAKYAPIIANLHNFGLIELEPKNDKFLEFAEESSLLYNTYSLVAQKWTSFNCVKGSTRIIFLGLQYELITIAQKRYPQPIKLVV